MAGVMGWPVATSQTRRMRQGLDEFALADFTTPDTHQAITLAHG